MTQSSQEYVDPILTPGNLRKIVENLPGKVKHQHGSYNYHADLPSLEDEIDEFFTYTEVTVQLQDYRRAYEKEFPHPSVENEKLHIISLLDRLECQQLELRLKACRHLLYISLGRFTADKDESKQQRIQRIKVNNNLLVSCNTFPVVFLKLQQVCAEYCNAYNNSQTNIVGVYAQIDMYLTLAYMMIETQRHQYPSDTSKQLMNDLVTPKVTLIDFLFSLISQIRQQLPDKQFPVLKLVLLLWKSMLFVSGGLAGIKISAEKQRASCNLASNADTVFAKSTPQDFYLFQSEITQRYPGYTAPKLSIPEASPLTLEVSSSTMSAMGYSHAIENTELLYQTLFPPKTGSANKNNKQQTGSFPSPSTPPAFPLPLSQTGSDVPLSVTEAGKAYTSNMHVSLSNYQTIKERDRIIRKWQYTADRAEKPEACLQQDNTFVERMYARIVADLQNVVVVLLKVLLAAITPCSSNAGADTNDNVTLEYLEEIDVKRNQEICSKAISGLLLLLLKWTKSSHVLKFEYISQLLVDSGCMLLVLKIVGLQEVTDMVNSHTDIPYYSFFDYNINRISVDRRTLQSVKAAGQFTNERNMYWAINYLRLLQMLTKHKKHRIILLAQYKSAAILKRLTKIAHPVLETYVLKLLKSQVPHLGRKWKAQNMRIISAIYLSCKTVLQDSWVNSGAAEDDSEDGKMEEQCLRLLIRTYNGERYLPSLLPVHDEVATANDDTPVGPGFSGYECYDSNQSINYDDLELEPDFTQNYRQWLESQVFNTDDEEEEIPNSNAHTPAPSTPYPDNAENHHRQFTPDELVQEINKLYVQELNAEFNPTVPFTVTPTKREEEDWDSPPAPKKLTPLSRFSGNTESVGYLRSSNQRREEDVFTEDEIIDRLLATEEKTVRGWFDSNDSKDIYTFKMFDSPPSNGHVL